MSESEKPVAVVGATGYIGGRLAPHLLERGHKVRAVARSASKLKCRPYAVDDKLEVAAADVLDIDSLVRALEGCYAAYYLVHSMEKGGGEDFAEKDRRAAKNMARAAEKAGLKRIIYLGGLGSADDKELSHHLKSRAETAEALASGSVPVTTLRAAMILGAGSASFEILRYLVERLPVMVTPRWVSTRSQPIAVSDVIAYLAGCLENQETAGLTLDIGGPDILSYREIFDIYAEEAGLPRRVIIPVPVLTPKLSSLWINLVTPVPGALARPLAEGLRNEVVAGDSRIRNLVPIEPLGVREAIRRAIKNVARQSVETCWSDAGEVRPHEWLACGDAPYAGGTVLECNYRAELDCPREQVWEVLRKAGGENGWFFADFLWQLRGAADKLIGGPGYRRGRRDPEEVRTGDALDFWRVLDVKEKERILLQAEMKLPGQAVLHFKLSPLPGGGCELSQVSRFLPKGLSGMIYWYALAPFHDVLFKGMLRAVADKAGCAMRGEPEKFSGGGEMCRLPEQEGGG